MENKNSEDVLKALKEAFKVMGEPIEIFSDEDTAFLSVVKKHLDGLGIVQKNNQNPCQYCRETNTDCQEWSCGQNSFLQREKLGQIYINQH